jgi:hypothetical protein
MFEKPQKRTSSKPRPLFGDDDPAIVLARRLSSRILSHRPDARVPRTTAQLQKWAEHIDRMLRLDDRSPGQIEAMIDWCQEHDFWRGIILSGDNLRKKFDQLQMQRERDARGTTGRRASTNGRGPGGPAFGSDEYYIEGARRLGLREPRPGTDPAPEGGGSAA